MVTGAMLVVVGFLMITNTFARLSGLFTPLGILRRTAMTETVRTPIGRADPEPTDDLDGGLAVSPGDIGERLWHFFISMRTGLALILALAVLGLIGTMLVQAPAGLARRPEGLRGLARVAPAEVRRLDGHLRHARLLLHLQLGLVPRHHGPADDQRAGVLGNRAPHLWKLTVHPRTDMSEPFFSHAPLSHARPPAGSRPAAAAAIVAGGLPATPLPDDRRTTTDDTIHVYADHNRWGPFGTVIAHLSLVVILVGALVGTAFGFRNDGLAVAVGSTVDIGNGTGLTVEATQLLRLLLRERQPERLRQRPRRLRDGQQVGAATVRVNQPMRVGDITFYQSYFGAGGRDEGQRRARARSSSTQGVPLEWTSNDGTRTVGHDHAARRRADDVRPRRRLG